MSLKYQGSLKLDYSRNNLLSEMGSKILHNMAQVEGMDPQHIFAYVASFYSDNEAHAQRMYDYFSKLIFLPSTPIIANVPINGLKFRGLPISCFLSEAEKNQNFSTINQVLNETMYFSESGGGIGTLWKIPTVGEIMDKEINHGVLPYIQLQGRLTRMSAGFARKAGTVATYLHISNAEIKSFIDMRKPSSGNDPEIYVPRFVHHGVIISDDFMDAVKQNKDWELLNSQGQCVEKTNARNLFLQIVKVRMETGEPFILFEGNVNRAIPNSYKRNKLEVHMTNLCTEITLATNKDRVAICCLGSINLEKSHIPSEIYEDILRFLDNILSFFIVEGINKKIGSLVQYEKEFGICHKFKALEKESIEKAELINHPLRRAVFSAYRERSVGIGFTGLDNLFKSLGLPLESKAAEELNKKIFQDMKIKIDNANKKLAMELGPCPDGVEDMVRFVHCTAIAPTANIANIQNTSSCIEPQMNIFVFKNIHGSIIIKNAILTKELQSRGLDKENVWNDFMENEKKAIINYLGKEYLELFKNPFEINQEQLVNLASQRNIDQSQSLNLYFTNDVDLNYCLKTHIFAYQSGIKSLYYLRSTPKIESNSFSQNMGDLLENLKNNRNINLLEKTCRVEKVQCVGCE